MKKFLFFTIPSKHVQAARVIISVIWFLLSLVVMAITAYAGNWWLLLAMFALINACTSGIIVREELKYL